MNQLIKSFFGLLLIPLTIAFAITLSQIIISFSDSSLTVWLFCAGVVCYPIFQAFLFRPLRIYILGHELTHAFFSILFGGKIKKLKVTKDGGSVNVTKSNFLVVLAPYFFPLYVFIFVLIWYILKQFYNSVLQPYYPGFVFLVGFGLGFHLVFTWYSLRVGQPDVKKTGLIFSMVLIFLGNLVILAILLKILFPEEVLLKDFFVRSWNIQIDIWLRIYVFMKNTFNLIFSQLTTKK